MTNNETVPVETYNIFAICQDFRQRIEQLNRLKEEMLKRAKDEE